MSIPRVYLEWRLPWSFCEDQRFDRKLHGGHRGTLGAATTRKEATMGKHLDPLQKEILIRRYLSNPKTKLSYFCEANGISEGAFTKWMKQYETQGLEGLSRADAQTGDVLPEGIDRTEENYKREILKLRIENERLKKKYTVKMENGEQVYIPLKRKNTK